MKSKKIALVLSITVAGVALLSACSSSTPAEEASAPPTPLTSGDEVKVVTVEGQLAEEFRSLAEITSASDVVVVGTVLEAKPAPDGNLAFTVSTVRVDEAIKGDLKAETNIEVVETGGLIASRTGPYPGVPGPLVEQAFDGVRVMAAGEQWLLFLRASQSDQWGDSEFHIKGVFQGKVRVEPGDKLHFTGSNPHDVGSVVPVQLDGRALGDVIGEVREFVKNPPTPAPKTPVPTPEPFYINGVLIPVPRGGWVMGAPSIDGLTYPGTTAINRQPSYVIFNEVAILTSYVAPEDQADFQPTLDALQQAFKNPPPGATPPGPGVAPAPPTVTETPHAVASPGASTQ